MYKIIENTYIGEDMYQMKVQGEFKGRMGQFYMLEHGICIQPYQDPSVFTI